MKWIFELLTVFAPPSPFLTKFTVYVVITCNLLQNGIWKFVNYIEQVYLREMVQGQMNWNPLGAQSGVFNSLVKKRKTVTPDPQIYLIKALPQLTRSSCEHLMSIRPTGVSEYAQILHF